MRGSGSRWTAGRSPSKHAIIPAAARASGIVPWPISPSDSASIASASIPLLLHSPIITPVMPPTTPCFRRGTPIPLSKSWVESVDPSPRIESVPGSSSKMLCRLSIPCANESTIIVELTPESSIQSIIPDDNGRLSSDGICISDAISTTLSHFSMLHIGSPA